MSRSSTEPGTLTGHGSIRAGSGGGKSLSNAMEFREVPAYAEPRNVDMQWT
jgi:hypothetical protein